MDSNGGGFMSKITNLKGALAFFLVLIAFVLVYTWMIYPPRVNDGNALALLAGFVTLMIKMAADAVGYQFQSSSGSDKKDDTMKALAAAATGAPPTVTTAPAPLVPGPGPSPIAPAAPPAAPAEPADTTK